MKGKQGELMKLTVMTQHSTAADPLLAQDAARSKKPKKSK